MDKKKKIILFSSIGAAILLIAIILIIILCLPKGGYRTIKLMDYENSVKVLRNNSETNVFIPLTPPRIIRRAKKITINIIILLILMDLRL